MKLQRHSHSQGSTLIIAMITVAVTAGFIAAYYESLIPKYRSAFHAADWHEALHGAEAGVDLVVQKLNQNVTSGNTPDSYDWTGWTLDPTYPLNGNRTLNNPIVMGEARILRSRRSPWTCTPATPARIRPVTTLGIESVPPPAPIFPAAI